MATWNFSVIKTTTDVYLTNDNILNAIQRTHIEQIDNDDFEDEAANDMDRAFINEVAERGYDFEALWDARTKEAVGTLPTLTPISINKACIKDCNAPIHRKYILFDYKAAQIVSYQIIDNR